LNEKGKKPYFLFQFILFIGKRSGLGVLIVVVPGLEKKENLLQNAISCRSLLVVGLVEGDYFAAGVQAEGVQSVPVTACAPRESCKRLKVSFLHNYDQRNTPNSDQCGKGSKMMRAIPDGQVWRDASSEANNVLAFFQDEKWRGACMNGATFQFPFGISLFGCDKTQTARHIENPSKGPKDIVFLLRQRQRRTACGLSATFPGPTSGTFHKISDRRYRRHPPSHHNFSRRPCAE
jgi:hypothetical protein